MSPIHNIGARSPSDPVCLLQKNSLLHLVKTLEPHSTVNADNRQLQSTQMIVSFADIKVSKTIQLVM